MRRGLEFCHLDSTREKEKDTHLYATNQPHLSALGMNYSCTLKVTSAFNTLNRTQTPTHPEGERSSGRGLGLRGWETGRRGKSPLSTALSTAVQKRKVQKQQQIRTYLGRWRRQQAGSPEHQKQLPSGQDVVGRAEFRAQISRLTARFRTNSYKILL